MLRFCMKTLVDIIRLFVDLKKYVLKLGVKDLTIFVLIWLEKEKYRVFKERNNTYIEFILETEVFKFF